MKTLLAVAGIAAAVLAAGSASAQPRQGGQGGFQLGAGSSITLYDLPNFQGQARTFNNSVDNLADLGLNDRAQSAKVQGRWRVCTDSGLRGRCVDLTGDVPNLATLGVTAAISSFQDRGSATATIAVSIAMTAASQGRRSRAAPPPSIPARRRAPTATPTSSAAA